MEGAPILNEWDSGTLYAGDIYYSYDIGFEVSDRRRVFLSVFLVPDSTVYYSGVPHEINCFYASVNQQTFTDKGGNTAGFLWSVTDGSSTLAFNSSNLAMARIRLIEYDVEIVSDQSPSIGSSETFFSLAQEIINPEKTYVTIRESVFDDFNLHEVHCVREFSDTAAWVIGNNYFNIPFKMPNGWRLEKAVSRNSSSTLYANIREFSW